ncbi:LysR family transcriptional regulator [Brevibacterium casei]|nr:LysR family transcriptional regulator [Brevibacterium casei]
MASGVAVVSTASSVALDEPSRSGLRLISVIITVLIVREKRTLLHNCARYSYGWGMHSVAHLQSFKSVAMTGSVRSAAHHLGLSPSAVSHHLKSLERETGLTLFTRRGRGLCLTETGASILGEIEAVLDSSSRLRPRISELQESRVNRLSIGYFASAGTRWSPELVAYLENRYPDTAVQLNLAEGPWRELSSDIQLVISESQELRFPVEVDSNLLVADPYVVAVPDDHRIASPDSISLAELEEPQWIDNDIGDGPCRTILFDACARAGVRIHFKHEAHSFPTALHMVSRGLGVTILPRLGIDPRRRECESCHWRIPLRRDTSTQSAIRGIRNRSSSPMPSPPCGISLSTTPHRLLLTDDIALMASYGLLSTDGVIQMASHG